jgi:hypothetical protein
MRFLVVASGALDVVPMRTTLAFLSAPLVAALLFALLSVTSPNRIESGVPHFLLLTFFAYSYAGPPALLVAVPAFLILKHFRLVRWWSALGVGAVVGLFFAGGLPGFSVPALQNHFGLPMIGAASGLTFWLIWKPVTPSNHRWRGP